MSMIRRRLSIVLLALAALPLASAAQPARASGEVPAALAVPDGNEFAFALEAAGVQIYDCKAASQGYAWVFRAPEAALFNAGGHQKGTHYAGPTWSMNGGLVVAARAAGANVDATAIPWLLLRAVSHDGRGPMAKVTYIQRVDTTGGLAPAAGCDAEHAGTEVRIRYTALYTYFTATGAERE